MAVSRLSRAEQLRYFFDRLENPQWLEPLYRKGFFTRVPEPVVSDDGSWVRFPSWPAGRYLARVAEHEPDLATQIVNAIETENQSVQQDLLETALAVPTPHCVRLLPKFRAWARQSRIDPFLAGKLGDVAAHLAGGGEIDSAISLAEAVLTPRGPAEGPLHVRLAAPFNDWRYKEVLSLLVVPLTEGSGVDAVRLFCRLLSAAVDLKKSGAAAVSSGYGREDYSHIWRPAVEEHAENEPEGLLDSLVSALRDSVGAVLERDAERLSELLQVLAEPGWKIFHRIGLHFVRLCPAVPTEILVEALVDAEKLGDPTIHHEYFLLSEEKFDQLPVSGRNTILERIEEGPDTEPFVSWRLEAQGVPPSASDIDEMVDRWRYDRLIPIRGHLGEALRRRFEEYRERFGEPDFPELSARGGAMVWVGEESPKTAEELLALDLPDIVSFVGGWPLPSGEARGPAGGLARALTEAVSREPERFASNARLLQNLGAVYVGAVFDGFRSALREGSSLTWEGVLELARWVIEESSSDRAAQESSRRDRAASHSGEARKALVGLLDQALRPTESTIPKGLLPSTAVVLAALAEDPDPTPSYEQEYSDTLDPSTVALNAVRPLALSALVRLGLRMREGLEGQPKMLERGFEAIPGVQAILDRHLDPGRDPALSVRSVYGRWLPWLHLLDPRWTSAAVSKIFPADKAQVQLYEAAWAGYVVYCKPFDGMLDLLQKQYHTAVDRIGSWGEKSTRPAEPDERLAEHLMTFYWRGELEIGREEGLLGRFFARAPADLRRRALEFVGRSLKNTSGEVDGEILTRLRTLWDDRTAAADSADQQESFLAEQGAFLWWFLSGKLDPEWVLPRLLQIFQREADVDSAYLLAEGLAELAPEYPLDCIRILSLAAARTDSAYLGSTAQAAFRTVVVSAFESDEPAAQALAEELLEGLGRRGELQFRDLMRTRRKGA